MSRLRDLEVSLRHDYYDSLKGERLQLLVESSQRLDDATGTARHLHRGTTCRYAPAEMTGTGDSANSGKVGQLVQVVVEECDDERLIVRQVN